MDTKKPNNRTKTTVAVIASCSILLLVLALSYAWLPTDNLPNEPEDATASTATLKLRYNDCASDRQEDCAEISADLAPGDSVTKTFEIKNIGTMDVNYDILFRELSNTFTKDELVYTLENLTTGYTEVSNIPVPYGERTNSLIKRKFTSKVGSTTKFRLTITFLNTDYDQEENQNAEFSMKLSIKETGAEPSDVTLAKLNVSANVNNPNFIKISPNKQITAKSTYKNFTNVVNDATYPYSYDEETGAYTSTNTTRSSTSEISFNLADSGQTYLCYEAANGNSQLYVNGELKTSLNGSSNCIDLGNVNTNDTLKVIYTRPSNGLGMIGYNSFLRFSLSKDVNMPIDDTGIYSMEDDYGVSYYYRGAVTNNYVKFADKYWRILRINGDGSLRVIYDGTTAHENGEASEDRFVGTSAWNDIYDDAKYVGYMFGGANGEASTSKEQAQTNTTDSTMKTYLDTWYQENILATGNAKYVSDTLFCNDRSTMSTPSSYGTMIGDTGLGYAQNATAFGYWNRFTYDENRQVSSVDVTLKCKNKNDAFTVKDTNKGNGNLTYPIGLMTSDEANVAGGKVYDGSATNTAYYLYKGSLYWLFSPAAFGGNRAIVSNVYGDGYLINGTVADEGAVAPVINLSSEFIENMTGDGSMTNPYSLS